MHRPLTNSLGEEPVGHGASHAQALQLAGSWTLPSEEEGIVVGQGEASYIEPNHLMQGGEAGQRGE